MPGVRGSAHRTRGCAFGGDEGCEPAPRSGQCGALLAPGLDEGPTLKRPHPIDRLAAIAHEFGAGRALEKRALLASLGSLTRVAPGRLEGLHATLYFLRAYPDDAAVLEAVRATIPLLRRAVAAHGRSDAFLDSGLPGAEQAHTFAYDVVQRLVARHPGSVEIDWEAFEPDTLTDALVLALSRGELRGYEDPYVELPGWLDHNRLRPDETDLEVVLRLLRGSGLAPDVQRHLYTSGTVPVRYRLCEPGQGRVEVVQEPRRPVFQHEPIPRETFPLAPHIRRPLARARRLTPAAGRRVLDLAIDALCTRNFEIFPLSVGDPAGVTVVECGRGLEVVLAGTRLDARETPETLLFFLISKNGVPIAYGPASVFLGCCDMGMNLFPEFRGGEVRFFYAELMRALFHLAGARYFYLPAYGMGEDNPEALETGAFWFYRKLGFSATEPAIERLARAEERKRRRDPRYRCSLAMLRRLSHTEAHLDLSGGGCTPVHFPRLGLAVSRHVTEAWGGDRRRAEREGATRLARVLGVRGLPSWAARERLALRQLAPVLGALRGLERWSARERRALVTAIRARAHDDMTFARLTAASRPLARAFHALVAGEARR